MVRGVRCVPFSILAASHSLRSWTVAWQLCARCCCCGGTSLGALRHMCKPTSCFEPFRAGLSYKAPLGREHCRAEGDGERVHQSCPSCGATTQQGTCGKWRPPTKKSAIASLRRRDRKNFSVEGEGKEGGGCEGEVEGRCVMWSAILAMAHRRTCSTSVRSALSRALFRRLAAHRCCSPWRSTKSCWC